jgi:ABC-type multidrug transport system fused ATPase/permease subunit
MLANMTDSLRLWACLIIGLVVLMSASLAFRSIENPDFVRNVRDALFRNIMEQELDYFDATSTGIFISRLSEDVVYVLDTYVDKLNNCLQFAAQTITGLVISFYLTWQVTLVGVAVVPVCAAVWALGEAKINKL